MNFIRLFSLLLFGVWWMLLEVGHVEPSPERDRVARSGGDEEGGCQHQGQQHCGKQQYNLLLAGIRQRAGFAEPLPEGSGTGTAEAEQLADPASERLEAAWETE